MLGLVRRISWLMLGAAIALAAVILAIGVTQLLALLVPRAEQGLLVAACLAIPLLGLLPGIRELEITAARSLLGVGQPLLLPDPPRPEHRVRTVGWVTLHLVSGLGVGVLLFAALPGAVSVIAAATTGAPLDVAGIVVPTDRAGLRVPTALVAVAVVAASLAAVWAVPYLARRLAPWFLGPTWHDQWELAQARLADEAAHARLARELHDGIGHALTIISVQATAAGRAGDPESTERGLRVIEQTAHAALAELDGVLGLLRDGAAASRHPDPDLRDLPSLLERHRGTGVRLPSGLEIPAAIPATVSRIAYRAIAEGLTNAERYADPGSVELELALHGDRLQIGVTSSGARARPSARRGHGLRVLADQVAVLGGECRAGPGSDGRWHLDVRLPTGVGRG